jgi:hypothetical protein
MDISEIKIAGENAITLNDNPFSEYDWINGI